ncbi:hypothetical protein HC864_00220 [Candidatus Gracilibacteria bacterium]|nr:hypothetical protein [Candidatus Gracilibacteria bacterium]
MKVFGFLQPKNSAKSLGLLDLKNKLEQFQYSSMEDLVKFFILITNYLDEYKERLGISKYQDLLCILRSAGRSSFGCCRVGKGERPTLDNTWMGGDIAGLPTHPVSFWMTKKDTKEELGFPGYTGNAYQILSLKRAKPFCESKKVSLLKELENIK